MTLNYGRIVEMYLEPNGVVGGVTPTYEILTILDGKNYLGDQ